MSDNTCGECVCLSDTNCQCTIQRDKIIQSSGSCSWIASGFARCQPNICSTVAIGQDCAKHWISDRYISSGWTTGMIVEIHVEQEAIDGDGGPGSGSYAGSTDGGNRNSFDSNFGHKLLLWCKGRSDKTATPLQLFGVGGDDLGSCITFEVDNPIRRSFGIAPTDHGISTIIAKFLEDIFKRWAVTWARPYRWGLNHGGFFGHDLTPP